MLFFQHWGDTSDMSDNYCIADTICPADVGLNEENLEDDRGHGFFGLQFNRVGRWAQPITYVDIHDGNNFTVSSFILFLLN